jgi:FimV-like protein
MRKILLTLLTLTILGTITLKTQAITDPETDLTSVNSQYQTRLADLEKQNADLQNQLQQITEQLSVLSAQVSQLDAKKNISWVDSINQRVTYKVRIVLFVIFALLLVILFYLIFISSKPKPTTVTPEHDFMIGKSGAQTKLDLAQAYSDMGNQESAKKLLAEVIETGNPEQKDKAKQMLAAIANNP